MFLFIISILLLFLFIVEIYNWLNYLFILEKVLAIFLIATAYIIVIFEIVGVIDSLNSPLIVLSTQLTFYGLIILLNRIFHIERVQFRIKLWFPLFHSLKSKIRNNPGIFIFSGIIFVTYIFILYIGIRFPQNTTDSMYNHLSRIGYWLQHSSLKMYAGFSNYGTSYPYNNSLLMLWSVDFLRSDRLVGLVQYISTFILALTVYLTGNELGFPKRGNLFAAVMVLTFPIIIFESITAQNDILVSSFLMIAYYFLLKNNNTGNQYFLVYSILAFALALGTKQNALFALPGYMILFLFSILKQRNNLKSIFVIGICCTFVFTLLFGSFAYIQNLIKFRNPIGDSGNLQQVITKNDQSLLDSILINSLRLSYQFLSCEGVPLDTEINCTKLKISTLGPVLTSKYLNLESPKYLMESDNKFTLDRLYTLNEESSWFGIHGWIILLSSLCVGINSWKKQKKIEKFLYVLASISFFMISVTFISLRGGWSPYYGRYMIFSVALISPFISLLFSEKNKIIKTVIYLICAVSIFSMIFCVLNNDSRPLISQRMAIKMELWGRENFILAEKIGYRIETLARNDIDLWSSDRIIAQTYLTSSFEPVVRMINKYVHPGSTMGVFSSPGMVPDYYFFIAPFDRIIVPIISQEQLDALKNTLDFLLVSPDFSSERLIDFNIIESENGWKLFIYDK